jgi:hypothetical protein
LLYQFFPEKLQTERSLNLSRIKYTREGFSSQHFLNLLGGNWPTEQEALDFITIQFFSGTPAAPGFQRHLQ